MFCCHWRILEDTVGGSLGSFSWAGKVKRAEAMDAEGTLCGKIMMQNEGKVRRRPCGFDLGIQWHERGWWGRGGKCQRPGTRACLSRGGIHGKKLGPEWNCSLTQVLFGTKVNNFESLNLIINFFLNFPKILASKFIFLWAGRKVNNNKQTKGKSAFWSLWSVFSLPHYLTPLFQLSSCSLLLCPS